MITWLRGLGIAAVAAVALALAFPKTGAAWLVPFGTAALFWCWQGVSWKRAATLGWFSGMVFFTVDYAWVGHTVGHYIGAFAPILPAGVALFEAPYFAIAGALAAIAYRNVRADVAPFAAAAIFAACEWLRSIGVLGAPFDQLGYTQADGPLRAIAAYAGTIGVTFALCVLGAYLADALHRRTWRPLAVAVGSLAAVTVLAWAAWPARHLPPPTIRVAAIQGNIAQSLKWNNLDLAIYRYSMLTQRASGDRPQLIVWPETVITTELNLYPELEQRFIGLARDAGATIVVGSVSIRHHRFYNSLYVISPFGDVEVYDKRQLVPFAEWFPGSGYLSWIPYVSSLNGGITPGSKDGVYATTALKIAPLICWESAFADLAKAQMRNGAQLLVVSTDDAWFGKTSGPYMHAQISQLRAIETGAYVVRAAATGISGIIAPDGTWQTRSAIDTMTVVTGKVGLPVTTLFARIGTTPVGAALVALYLLAFIARRPAPERTA